MIKKCLFPAAGYGTRFLPATKSIPKEMLPVVNKPLIHYGIDEARKAGINEFGFVTGRSKRAIEDYLDYNPEIELSIKGSSKEKLLADTTKMIEESTFTYVRQKQMKGLGHAILSGEPLIGNNPFAVILADDLCEGDVLSQMVKLYNKFKCSIVAIEEVPKEDTSKYGIISGKEIEKGVFIIDNMVEKPDPKNAPTNLAIIGRYILTPDIFREFDELLNADTPELYLTEAIDKNLSNILKIAEQERKFVERLLFTEDEIPFKINRPSIKLLHVNGLIKKDPNGNVAFWVPLYKKGLYDAFYPYTNGERKEISRTIFYEEYFDKNGNFKIEKLISAYKEYVKRRSLKVFLEKDDSGNYKSIKESALIYSFETFISAVVSQLNGRIYREAEAGLGKTDMILNFNGKEFIIETKVYYAPKQFTEGKKQLAYYCESAGLKTGIYLVFKPANQKYPKSVKEQTETINNVSITTYLIEYDDTKW